jgi:tight adherence protein B
MNPSVVILLTCCSTMLLVVALGAVVYDGVFRYRAQLRERINELSGAPSPKRSATLFDSAEIRKALASERLGLRARFQAAVVEAELSVQANVLFAAACISGFAAGCAAYWISGMWFFVPVAVTCSCGVLPAYVFVKQARRRRKMTNQLPDAFDVLGRAVQAGHSMASAIQIIADDFPPPISDEFRKTCEKQRLGMSHEACLRSLAMRTGIMELRLFVVALLVQSRAGGNMMELIGNLSAMVRNRLKLQSKVKSLTAEGRLQAAILIALPFIAFISIQLLSPDYLTALRERPWLLAAAGTAQFTGALWIKRIVSFDI